MGKILICTQVVHQKLLCIFSPAPCDAAAQVSQARGWSQRAGSANPRPNPEKACLGIPVGGVFALSRAGQVGKVP